MTEEKEYSPEVYMPKMMKAEFRWAGAQFIATIHPGRYQFLIPIIQTMLTYEVLREHLKQELPKYGYMYESLITNKSVISDGNMVNIYIIKESISQRYLELQTQFSLLDKYTVRSVDEKKLVEIINKRIRKLCVGLAAINTKVLLTFLILMKKTDLAGVSIPTESIAQARMGNASPSFNYEKQNIRVRDVNV